jgi:hypothetical protein
MSAKEYNEAKQEKRRQGETIESHELYVPQVYRASDFKRPGVCSKINPDSDFFFPTCGDKCSYKLTSQCGPTAEQCHFQLNHGDTQETDNMRARNALGGGVPRQRRNELSFQTGRFALQAHRNEIPHFSGRSSYSYIPAIYKVTETRTRTGQKRGYTWFDSLLN